ncbi:MAG TPA: GNAT family N-acetyltransferase [Noviherbaspirillum sp.]|nr:GNAT family N-acetyltransferase [Noviherbaspirillum sp.]
MKTVTFEAERKSTSIPSALSTFHRIGKAELKTMESRWRAVEARTGGPIEQFDWAVACAMHTDASEVEVVGVMRGEELRAVVPLAIKRIAGVKRRMMLGVDEYFEPMDFLFSDAQSLQRLMQQLARDRRPMLLSRVPTDSGSLDALRQAFRKRALVVERPGEGSPFIPLDPSWSEPEQHLNAGRRSDLRRMRRRLDSMGKAESAIHAPTPDQLDALLEEAFQVEARSWKGAAGTALLYDAKRRNHLRSYLKAAARSGEVRIGLLRLDGRAIAMEIAIQRADALWLLKIGYDAAFAHCAPGQLLLRDTIEHAARTGLKNFEFLGVSAPWIDVWSLHKHDCVAVWIYPPTVQGMLGFMADSGLRLARMLRRLAISGRRRLIKSIVPVLNFAAKSYIAGETLADAMRVAEKVRANGASVTIGYWNTEDEKPAELAEQDVAGLDQLAHSGSDDYLSVKLPALHFKKELVSKLSGAAAKAGRRIHFDSHGIEYVVRKMAVCEELKRLHPDLDIGFTLPGRWARSVDDADWVCRQGLFVRVVKGQWPDPAQVNADPEQGFMNVIERLAGRARKVAVATHDPRLAERALRRLQAAGTPCEMELLYGLPLRRCMQVARERGVPMRIYIPYGEAYLPYALSQLRDNPRILWWLLRDSVAALRPGVGSYRRDASSSATTGRVRTDQL